MSRKRPNNGFALNIHGIFSLFRLFLVGLMLMSLAWFGAVVFDNVNFIQYANRMVERWGIIRYIPWREFWVTALLNPASYRYYIVPIAALFAVFLGAAFYVKDIYALKDLRSAIHYILSSMFGLLYPALTVDGGEQKIPLGKTNLIDEIGGPGLVTIQPGNVVMFRRLREPSNITLRETYFVEPFERIGQIANLDDQMGTKDNIPAMTRDGINVIIKEIKFRYRIFPEKRFGRPIRPTLSDPYPFDEKALWNIAYNLSVEENGLEMWRAAVARVVTGGITDFINAHDVDYITAPRDHRKDPRQEIRDNLFFSGIRIGLASIGAELLWVDIGHFSIENQEVDETRENLWASDWRGKAEIERTKGETRLAINEELGRAEAQAEIIAAIAESLKTVDLTRDPASNLRRIILVRTAQMLDSLDARRRNLETGNNA
jgi:hypothetical protein